MKTRRVRIAKFLKAVENSGGIQSVIAKRMGITPTSLCEWLKRNPEFYKYLEEEDNKRVDTAITTITKDLGNIETAKWFLLKYKKGREKGYNDKPETQVNVQNNLIERKIIIEVVDERKDKTKSEAISSVPISD